MNPPEHHTPTPEDLRREKERIRRARRESADAYAARIIRELETMEESEPLNP